MSLFQEAANFNNRGLTALSNGHYKSAVESMAHALKLVHEELACNTNAASILGSDTSVAGHIQCIQTVEISRNRGSSDTAAIFNHAFKVLPYPDQNITSLVPPQTTQIERNIIVSTVVFNLALAHHFQGSRDAQKTIKAEKFYTMAFRLLDDASYSDIPSAIFIKLACINNISHIRGIKGDQNVARESLDQVSALMQRVSNHEIFEEPNIHSLLLSVLLIRPTVAAAAA